MWIFWSSRKDVLTSSHPNMNAAEELHASHLEGHGQSRSGIGINHLMKLLKQHREWGVLSLVLQMKLICPQGSPKSCTHCFFRPTSPCPSSGLTQTSLPGNPMHTASARYCNIWTHLSRMLTLTLQRASSSLPAYLSSFLINIPDLSISSTSLPELSIGNISENK